MIGLLVGGPVGRFKGSVTKEGMSWEADGDPVPSAKVTTTVETPGPQQ
jgi:hypothetical protein